MFLLILAIISYCGVLGNYQFHSEKSIYDATFQNCTVGEHDLMKCINGVCLSRSDTIERQPFCMCFAGYDGMRCETTELPHLPMSTKCETGIPIGILICVNACALLGMVLLQYLYYIKRGERTRIAYPQHKLPFTTRSE